MSESHLVVSDSLWPPGLYSPWNSPGQNTGVGSLSLLQGSSQPRDWTQVSCLAGGLFTSWATQKPKNTGVDSLSLLQWIFPTQETNWGLLHCRQILYQLSHTGSQTILEWVAYPFSNGSSQPRNQTGVSCTAGRFLTSWATREAFTELKDTSKHTPWHGPAQWGQAPETRTRIL